MRAVIFGCKGPNLSPTERSFFRETQPWGFILFARNCQSSEQMQYLCNDLRATIESPNAPILIDQEGGRVMRLTPPVWRPRPAMDRFGALHKLDPKRAYKAARLGAQLLARDIVEGGVNVNCVPVLDVPQSDTHDAIGDRALATHPEMITHLGTAIIEGTLAAGALPVMKHLPGHGRSLVDSHLELPRVNASRAELSASDFVPFKHHNQLLMAMTNHIVYEAFDPDHPTTMSKTVIEEVIRNEIGFEGLLMSDDFSMKALSGDFAHRSRGAIAAGCDIILHCNGNQDEMQEIAAHTPLLTGSAHRRAARVIAQLDELANSKKVKEIANLEEDLEQLLKPVWRPS